VILCRVRLNIFWTHSLQEKETPRMVIANFEGEYGKSKATLFTRKCETKLEFSEGGSLKPKILSWEGYQYFLKQHIHQKSTLA